jgi:hypothetical protein
MTLVEPLEPNAAVNNVVCEVHASGFTPGELTCRLQPDRSPGPRPNTVIPGHELAGMVSTLGYGTRGCRRRHPRGIHSRRGTKPRAATATRAWSRSASTSRLGGECRLTKEHLTAQRIARDRNPRKPCHSHGRRTEQVAFAVRRVGEHLLDRSARAGLVLGPRVGNLDRVGRRQDVGKIKLRYLRDRVEDL